MKKNEIREGVVLRALVTEFISTNDTVASGLLCKKYVPDVSPATVRIDLHKLEQKNLIFQPHTSAGRIPTTLGFRKYLKMIASGLGRKSYDKSDLVRDFIIKNFRDTPQTLHYIMRILAKETDQLSFVAEPEISYGFLKRLEAFRIGNRKLLFVVSLNSGLDKTVILNTDYDLTEQQLRVLVRYANDELMGLRIYDIQHHYLEHLNSEEGTENQLLSAFLRELHKVMIEISSYYIHFDSNITFLEQPEFNEKQNILRFLNLIQQQDFLISLMEKHLEDKPFHVLIGEDLGHPNFNDVALVFARYEIFEVPGYIGVLAPIRMDYERNIPIIRDIAQVITKTTKKGMMVPKYEKR